MIYDKYHTYMIIVTFTLLNLLKLIFFIKPIKLYNCLV